MLLGVDGRRGIGRGPGKVSKRLIADSPLHTVSLVAVKASEQQHHPQVCIELQEAVIR